MRFAKPPKFYCQFIGLHHHIVDIQPTANNNSKKKHNYLLFIFFNGNFFSFNSTSAIYKQRWVKFRTFRKALGPSKKRIFRKISNFNIWAEKNWRKRFESWNFANSGTYPKKYVWMVFLRVLFIVVFIL